MRVETVPLITEEVQELVNEVYDSLNRPSTEDLILDVFKSIRVNRDWYQRYRNLREELGPQALNQFIGKSTRQNAGCRVLRSGVRAKGEAADLIGSYSQLDVPA